MNAPVYGTPLQPNGYQPAPASKNKGLIIGIVVAASIVVIVAVVLIIVLTGAGGGGSLQGTYYLNSESTQGTTLNRDQIKEYFGADITLTVGENNQGTLNYGSQGSIPVSFDPDKKTVTSSVGNGSYSLSGNKLTITYSEGGAVDEFIRQ